MDNAFQPIFEYIHLKFLIDEPLLFEKYITFLYEKVIFSNAHKTGGTSKYISPKKGFLNHSIACSFETQNLGIL